MDGWPATQHLGRTRSLPVDAPQRVVVPCFAASGQWMLRTGAITQQEVAGALGYDDLHSGLREVIAMQPSIGLLCAAVRNSARAVTADDEAQ